jgi:hypothetical protein
MVSIWLPPNGTEKVADGAMARNPLSPRTIFDISTVRSRQTLNPFPKSRNRIDRAQCRSNCLVIHRKPTMALFVKPAMAPD